MSRLRLDHANGANKNGPGAAKKTGSNKGIKAARQAEKRVEAEARNAATPPELRRRYRTEMLSERDAA